MQTDTIENRLTKAKVNIILNDGLAFFASLMMKRPFIADSTIATACTNGKVVRYNPQFFDGLSQDELVFVICHELMHITLLHHTRRGCREVEMWNHAADYAINPILHKAGLKLIKGVLMDAKYLDMSAETIYNILEQEKMQQQEQQQQEQKDEQDEEQDGADGQESPDNTSQDDEEGEGDEEGNGEGDENDEGDGEGEGDGESDETDGDGEGDSTTPDMGIGGVEDTPAASESELEQAEAETKQEVAAAMQIAKSQGKMPAFLESMAKAVLEPRVAWQEVLSRFINDTSKSDYSFMRPNRRFAGRVVMPSLHKEEIGGIVLVIDTSGSVFGVLDLLDKFATEMQEVCSMIQSPITVLHVDTKVQGEPDIIEPDDTFILKPRGGGGTDFRPAFEWLEENDTPVKAMVYFTDMECYDYPSEEPAYPVLWARYGSDRSVPPFGEIIQVDGFR